MSSRPWLVVQNPSAQWQTSVPDHVRLPPFVIVPESVWWRCRTGSLPQERRQCRGAGQRPPTVVPAIWRNCTRAIQRQRVGLGPGFVCRLARELQTGERRAGVERDGVGAGVGDDGRRHWRRAPGWGTSWWWRSSCRRQCWSMRSAAFEESAVTNMRMIGLIRIVFLSLVLSHSLFLAGMDARRVVHSDIVAVLNLAPRVGHEIQRPSGQNRERVFPSSEDNWSSHFLRS